MEWAYASHHTCIVRQKTDLDMISPQQVFDEVSNTRDDGQARDRKRRVREAAE